CGIAQAIVPKLPGDRASSRRGGGKTAGHMGHEDDLCSHERRDANILGQIVVVADEETRLPSQQIDHFVSSSGSESGIDEGVKFMKFCDESVGTDRNV